MGQPASSFNYLTLQATADGGRSAYGMRAINGSRVLMHKVTVNAANGPAGQLRRLRPDGATGRAGDPAQWLLHEQPRGRPRSGGLGGGKVISDGPGYNGGNGGAGASYSFDPDSGNGGAGPFRPASPPRVREAPGSSSTSTGGTGTTAATLRRAPPRSGRAGRTPASRRRRRPRPGAVRPAVPAAQGRPARAGVEAPAAPTTSTRPARASPPAAGQAVAAEAKAAVAAPAVAAAVAAAVRSASSPTTRRSSSRARC